MSYCKRVGTDGPVYLYSGSKRTNKEFMVCELDGSDIGAAPPAPAPAPVVEAPNPSHKKKIAIPTLRNYTSE